MKADAIIFDKDGTLLDFDAFWVAVSVSAVNAVLKQEGREDIPISEFFSALGVHNGVTDIDGVLCKGTYEQIGDIVYTVLSDYGCSCNRADIIARVVAAYNANAASGEVKPTSPDVKDVLCRLHKRNIKLAVVTTDNAEITHKCLSDLGIEELFDKVYTDDGSTPVKPDPFCAFDFEKFSKTERSRIIMVGDTMTDVTFAKNAGISVVSIAKSEDNRKKLASYADAVITSLSELEGILE